MLEKEQYLAFHSQFYDTFTKSPVSTGNYLPYDHYSIPSDRSMGPRWFLFSYMGSNLVRELLNTINGYYTNLRKLESWNFVLAECKDELRNDFIFEIINPFASYTLNYVSIVKQRLIYAACMLSHQTAMLLDPSIQDSELLEHKITFKSLKNYSGNYRHMDLFSETLGQIDSPSFRDSTSNYRNLYHHRIPPRIELGLSGCANRTVDKNGKVSYGLGGKSPLKLVELIPLLHEQYHSSTLAFKKFWDLIEEQVSIWETKSPNTT